MDLNTKEGPAYKSIANDIRRQCQHGMLLPGMKLPRREELVQQYGASATTVQQAINQLVADGLLKARGRAGTFVEERPRHITDMALVFPELRENPYAWRQFYDVLAASSALWQWSNNPKRFTPYCCPPRQSSSVDIERLHEDILNVRIGGIIHASTAIHGNISQWQADFDIPFVSITPKYYCLDRREAVVALSYNSFFSLAIEFMAKKNRNRVAILMSPDMYYVMGQQHIEKEATRCGVEIRPEWKQFIALSSPNCARSITHLLMKAAPSDRPNGIILADDNIVNHAIQGIHDAGVNPGIELDVIAHGNFPNSSNFGGAGITRLGFDSRTILGAGIKLIDDWRETGCKNGLIDVDAIFESDLWNVKS